MQKHPQARHHTDITLLGTMLRYVQLPWLIQQYPHIPVFALYNFLSGFLSIGLMAAFAFILHSPFIFPSLGPTAFHYFSRQTAPTASPPGTVDPPGNFMTMTMPTRLLIGWCERAYWRVSRPSMPPYRITCKTAL